MSTTTYTIERAKTGRSGCKPCGEKIAKGELRLGILANRDEDFSIQKWVHPLCFTLPAKLKKEGITPENFVSDMLEDTSDDQDILQGDDGTIVVAQIAAKREKKKVAAEAEGGRIAKIKANILDQQAKENGESGRAKKKAKLTGEQEEEMEVYKAYQSYKGEELKDFLRWNKQKVVGTKPVLLVRCLDGHIHGRLGMCPLCEKGQLKLEDDDDAKVYCNGYYDEDIAGRLSCTYKSLITEAPRLHPWFTQKPTDQEQEEIGEQMGKASTGKGKTVDGNNKTSGGDEFSNHTNKLCKLAKDTLEWKLDTKEGIRAATAGLIDLLTTHNDPKLDLPVEKTKMKVGKIVMGNKASDASTVMEVLVETFGFVQVKNEAAEKKHKATSNMCTHPANAHVVEAMMEFRELYFKAKNINAGTTYGKVANAVKDLDFEITEVNAKQLGKGKTKVDGIGKGSADKIFELVTTGKIEKLEEKRAAA